MYLHCEIWSCVYICILPSPKLRPHGDIYICFTFFRKWNEPYLPLLPGYRVSPHCGWYSFPVPVRIGGWVGLGGLVKYWGGLPAEDGHPSQYYDNHIHITQPSAKYMYLIATFHSPTANFIMHMVTWRWRWASDQNMVIGHWKVIGPCFSLHTVGLLAYTDWLLELSCSPMTFSV